MQVAISHGNAGMACSPLYPVKGFVAGHSYEMSTAHQAAAEVARPRIMTQVNIPRLCCKVLGLSLEGLMCAVDHDLCEPDIVGASLRQCLIPESFRSSPRIALGGGRPSRTNTSPAQSTSEAGRHCRSPISALEAYSHDASIALSRVRMQILA